MQSREAISRRLRTILRKKPNDRSTSASCNVKRRIAMRCALLEKFPAGCRKGTIGQQRTRIPITRQTA